MQKWLDEIIRHKRRIERDRQLQTMWKVFTKNIWDSGFGRGVSRSTAGNCRTAGRWTAGAGESTRNVGTGSWVTPPPFVCLTIITDPSLTPHHLYYTPIQTPKTRDPHPHPREQEPSPTPHGFSFLAPFRSSDRYQRSLNSEPLYKSCLS